MRQVDIGLLARLAADPRISQTEAAEILGLGSYVTVWQRCRQYNIAWVAKKGTRGRKSRLTRQLLEPFASDPKWSYRSTARALGVHPCTVYQAVHRLYMSWACASSSHSRIRVSQVKSMLLGGATQSEVAKELGVSRERIRQIRVRLGLPSPRKKECT